MKATTTTKPTSALPAVMKELRGRRQHVNGECWLDSNGEPIQAHGGGVMFHDDAYYWYGENRAGVRLLSDHDRRAAVGVSCYRSLDLLTWENLGVALSAVE